MYESNGIEQLELLSVKETKGRHVPAKRVDIVSLKMVKEATLMYKNRCVRSPDDGYKIFKQFLGELDREYLVVMCLDTKNQPTAINIAHICSLNSSIVHPREVMKVAILSNSSSIFSQSSQRQTGSSNEDSRVTKRLVKAGEIIGIDVLLS